MRLGILVKPILETLNGLNVACDAVLRAVIQNATFSAIILFYLPEHQKTAELYRDLNPGRVTIRPVRQIPRVLENGAVDLLLGLDPRLAVSLAECRNHYSKKPIPVVSFIHTLSSPHVITAFSNIATHFQEFDAILSTSSAGEQVITNIFSRIRDQRAELRYRGQSFRVPLPVDTSFFKPTTDQKHVRRQLNWPEDELIFGCVGRISAVSKMEYTTHLVAFKMFCEQTRQNARLVIMGHAQSEPYLQKLKMEAKLLGILDRVVFILNFERDSAPHLYQAMDVFLSFSDHVQETFGQTVVEAMACGTGVVVSDWNGYKDLVSHQKTGFLIPTYWADCLSALDNNAMAPVQSLGYIFDRYFYQIQCVAVDLPEAAAAMVKLADPDLRQKLGQAARRASVRRYGFKAVSNRLVEVGKTLHAQLPDHWVPQPQTAPVPFFDVFNHYPTQVLNGGAIVRRTARGQDYADGKTVMTEYEELGSYHSPIKRVIPKILDQATDWVSVESLSTAIGGDADDVMFNVLLGLKYHLLELKRG